MRGVEPVARQTVVKAKYELWVTAAERDAMARVLAACPKQRAPESNLPTVAAVAPQKPSSGGGTYASCAAVRAAGKAPIRRGQPGYSLRLDRDGDGVACDTTTQPTSRPPRSSSPAAGAATSYANCAEVRAAGKAPIRRGQPGYSTRLDRDRDGIACQFGGGVQRNKLMRLPQRRRDNGGCVGRQLQQEA